MTGAKRELPLAVILRGAFVPLGLILLLVLVHSYHYLLFHILVEFFSIITGILMFVVVWHTYNFSRNDYLLYLGSGYFWVAVLGIGHALTYKGMGIITPFHDSGLNQTWEANTSIQMWLGMRCIEAVLLLTSPVYLKKSMPKYTAFILYGCFSLLIFALILWDWFPVVFIVGKGLTAFKVGTEYFIITLLALSIWRLNNHRQLIEPRIFYLMVAAMAFTMVAELFFTFYISVYGLSNMIGHFFTFFSYWLIFAAITQTTLTEPFRVLARHSQTYDVIPDPTVVVDHDGYIVQSNRAARELSEAQKQSTERLHCHELLHPQQASRANCPLCRQIERREALIQDEAVFHHDRWYSFSLVPVEMPLGTNRNFQGMVYVRTDVTRHKQAEQQLNQAHTLLQTIFDSTPMLLAYLDTDFNFVKVNPEYAARMKQSEKTLCNQNYFALHPEKEWRDMLQNVLRSGIPYARLGHELRIPTDSTGINYWDIHLVPVLGNKGNVSGILLSLVDVTGRIKAEGHIMEMAEIIEQAPVTIVMANLEGNIVYANPYFEQVSGYTLQEIIGKNPRILSAGKKSKAFYEELWATITTGKTWHGQFINRHKNGDIYYEDASIFPIKDHNDIITRYAAVKPNTTERVKAEEALQKAHAELERKVEIRTAELQRANQELRKLALMKDEFLASVSHELRSPLNAILGGSEILLEQDFGELNPKQLKLIRRIDESGTHLLGLINDILDLAKVDAGKMKAEITQITPASVCEACVNLSRETATKKRILLESRCDVASPLIQADPKRLKQILINLLSNAIKFTPEQGRVSLEFKLDNESNQACFIVSDSGIGIAEDKLKHIFEPFVQLDSSLARAYEGTGLGLALAKKLADLHGGVISVESRLGEGSRFTVSLPWKPVVSGQTNGENKLADNREDPLAPQDALVMVVDDSVTNRLTVCEYLEYKGYRTIHAEDGLQALERIAKTPPDLVIMDIQMPGMDGLEAIRRLRQQAELAGLPIIALTALAMPGDKERCIQAGANDYLSKPVRLKELSNMIQLLLENSKTGEST